MSDNLQELVQRRFLYVVLAYKDLLRKSRPVRDEFRLLRTSIDYIRRAAPRIAQVGVEDDDLTDLTDLLDLQLASLALIEADLLEDMHVLQHMLASVGGVVQAMEGGPGLRSEDDHVDDPYFFPLEELREPGNFATVQEWMKSMAPSDRLKLARMLTSVHPRATSEALLELRGSLVAPPWAGATAPPLDDDLASTDYRSKAAGPWVRWTHSRTRAAHKRCEHLLAGLRVLAQAEVVEILKGGDDTIGTDPDESGSGRPLGRHDPRRVVCAIRDNLGTGTSVDSLPRGGGLRSHDPASPRHLIQLVELSRDIQLHERRARTADAAVRLRQRQEGLRTRGMSVLAEFLYRLRRLDDSLKGCFDVLSSTRRTVERWIESRPPGYPPVPRTHKQDREFLHRNFRTIVREAAAAMERLCAEVSHTGRAGRRGSPLSAPIPLTVAFTDKVTSRARVDGDRLSIEVPLAFLETPRYLVDLYHECAHMLLPDEDGLTRPGALEPWAAPLVHRLLLQLRWQPFPELKDQEGYDRAAITEVMADLLALAVAGPGFAIGLLIQMLPRSRWMPSDGEWQYLSPMLRAQVLLVACAALWVDLPSADKDAIAAPETQQLASLPAAALAGRFDGVDDRTLSALCSLLDRERWGELLAYLRDDQRARLMALAAPDKLAETLRPAFEMLHDYRVDLQRRSRSRDARPEAQDNAMQVLQLTDRMRTPLARFAIRLVDGLSHHAPAHSGAWIFRGGASTERLTQQESTESPLLEDGVPLQELWGCFRAFTHQLFSTDKTWEGADQWCEEIYQARRKGGGRARACRPRGSPTDPLQAQLQLVSLNAPHLVWEQWLAQHLTVMDQPKLLVWREPVEVAAFLYLGLLRYTTEARYPPILRKKLAPTTRMIPPKDQWDRDYFGPGILFTLALFNTNWGDIPHSEDTARPLGEHRTRALRERWFKPWEDYDWLHGYGRTDFVRLHNAEFYQPPRPGVRQDYLHEDRSDPIRSGHVGGAHYLRHIDYELLDQNALPDEVAQHLHLETTNPRHLFAPAVDNPNESVMVYLHNILIQGLPQPEHGGGPAGSRYGLGELVTRLTKGDTLRLAALARSFSWSDVALWLESDESPAKALSAVVAAAEEQDPAVSRYTDTTVLFRWSPLVREVQQDVLDRAGDPEEKSEREYLISVIEHLAKWYAEQELEADTAEPAAVATRMWIDRTRFKQNRVACKEVLRDLNKTLQVVFPGKNLHHRFVTMNLALGGEDLIALLRIPGLIPSGPRDVPIKGKPHLVEAGVLAQVFTCLLFLFTVRLLMRVMDAYEVVSHLHLELAYGDSDGAHVDAPPPT